LPEESGYIVLSIPIQKKEKNMQTLKDEAIKLISEMPESVDIDEIMYQLYVIDKIRKARNASNRGETVSTDDLKKEIEKW
jgi:hypothetical protein